MSRVFAWLVLCAYLCVGLVAIGWTAAVQIGLAAALPLACILFPEIMAEAGRGFRKDPLPEGMVFGLGWFTFLLPGMLVGLVWLML